MNTKLRRTLVIAALSLIPIWVWRNFGAWADAIDELVNGGV